MASKDSYAQLSMHRWMLRDEVRNEAYRQAISQVVKPGDTVLDVGAGTGILSMFAAQAGARKVYAVERSAIARIARRIIRTNGFTDQIEVIQANLEDVDLPEKVDVIVSEWMGGLGVDENMFAPVVMARDRWLKPGGKMIPERVTALLAPAWVEDVEETLGHWRSRPHGLDLSDIATLTVNEMHMLQSRIEVDDLLTAPQPLWSHDAYTFTLSQADSTFAAELKLTAERTGKLNALATWFVADMSPGVTLTNAVGVPNTHWGRLLLSLDQTVVVEKGTQIAIELRCHPTGRGSSEFEWSIKLGDGPLETYDTARPRG